MFSETSGTDPARDAELLQGLGDANRLELREVPRGQGVAAHRVHFGGSA